MPTKQGRPPGTINLGMNLDRHLRNLAVDSRNRDETLTQFVSEALVQLIAQRQGWSREQVQAELERRRHEGAAHDVTLPKGRPLKK